MTNIFTDDDMDSAKQSESLGPHYFSARRIAREFTSKFEADALKPLIDDAADKFRNKLWEDLQIFLWDDTERNLQHQMWQTVDQIVKGVLSGEKWIMDRYVLGSRYDCEKARAAIAGHIGDEVAKARIADLEAELEGLRKDIAWLRER